MMSYLRLITQLVLIGLSVVSISAASIKIAKADTLTVEYKSFYSHVRKLNSEDTNALQFAFGFLNIHTQRLCTIKSAHISTQKQQIQLNVSEEGRFTVPSEKALNMAKALVIIELSEAANICDMSVQLETVPNYLTQNYSPVELNFLFSQYTAFFDKMGGFLSFLMPKVDGLTFFFTDKTLNQALNNGLVIKNGTLILGQEQFGEITDLKLPQKPLRITSKTK